jgi:hypothetical protein
MLGWFGLRVLIPFLPVIIDFALRYLLLADRFAWWQMVDLKTFSISGAFFCLLIAIESKLDSRIPSDEKYEAGLQTFKTHMTVAGVFLAVLFGTTTLSEYQDIRSPSSKLGEIMLPASFVMMFGITFFALATAFFANKRYKFQF